MYDRNLLTQRAAVSELHELSYTTNMFTSITDENIEVADDTYGGDMSDMTELKPNEEKGLEANT